MFASPAYADWEKVGDDAMGNTYYVDIDRIRKVGGYVYYWVLGDYTRLTEHGYLSYKTYSQGDCEMFRRKALSGIPSKQPMGNGGGDTYSPPNPEWRYPPPNSVGEEILKKVCEYAETL